MRIRQGLHFAGHDLNVCKDVRTGSGALFWDYPGYSCSGLGITESGQNAESLKECDFSYSDKPKHSDRIPSFYYREYITEGRE